MISLEQAIKIVLDKINPNGKLDENPPLILRDFITVYKFGWLIPYDSEDHVVNGRTESAYIGGVPVFVDKFDGTSFYCNQVLQYPEEKIKKYGLKKYPEIFINHLSEEE